MKTFRTALCLTAITLACASCRPQVAEELLFEADAAYAHWVGKPVELSFQAIDGRPVDLARMRGKVVLLDFWATWCGPCMRELPRLKQVYQRLNPQGFEIVGISFDQNRQALDRVVQSHRIPWPQYFDGRGRDTAPGRKFGIKHYPSMWLVDQQGVVRFISAGANLEEKVKKLLREGKTSTQSKPISHTLPAPQSSANTVSPKDAALENSPAEALPEEPRPDAHLVLQGMRLRGLNLGTTRRLAILDTGVRSYTIAPGEFLTVKTSDEDLQVRCVEIGTNSVLLLVGDSTEPRRLILSGH